MFNLFLLVLSSVSAFIWLVLLLMPVRWRMVTRWEATDSSALQTPQWPSLSVIIPARNEEDSLTTTLPSWLTQNYPDPEVILIDDESSDQTVKRAETIAAQNNSRLCIIRGTPPPPGWTGKLWALQQGISISRGEWLLFTDADIFHHPGLWRGLVGKALAEKQSLVSLMAFLDTNGFWPRLLIPAFVFFFHILYPFKKVNDRRSSVSAAAGGCILIARSALDKIGGIEGHRNAWIDDLALAKRIKQASFPISLFLTRSAVSIRPYHNLSEVWKMVSRNAFIQLRCSWFLLFITVLGMAVFFLIPPGGICAWVFGSASPAALCFSSISLVLMFITYIPILRFFRLSTVRAVTFPFVGMLYAAMTFSSAMSYLTGRREWRGRQEQTG